MVSRGRIQVDVLCLVDIFGVLLTDVKFVHRESIDIMLMIDCVIPERIVTPTAISLARPSARSLPVFSLAATASEMAD